MLICMGPGADQHQALHQRRGVQRNLHGHSGAQGHPDYEDSPCVKPLKELLNLVGRMREGKLLRVPNLPPMAKYIYGDHAVPAPEVGPLPMPEPAVCGHLMDEE
jgi:hypothetical protein